MCVWIQNFSLWATSFEVRFIQPELLSVCFWCRHQRAPRALHIRSNKWWRLDVFPVDSLIWWDNGKSSFTLELLVFPKANNNHNKFYFHTRNTAQSALLKRRHMQVLHIKHRMDIKHKRKLMENKTINKINSTVIFYFCMYVDKWCLTRPVWVFTPCFHIQ